MRMKGITPWSRGRNQVAERRGNGDPLQALQSGINSVFEDFWRGFDLPTAWRGGLGSDRSPKVDVRETDKEVQVVAELPGLNEADIEVGVAEGALTIRGEKKEERESKEKGYILHERTFGQFERVVPLPDGLDIDAAVATFKNGVLTVKIPKTAEAKDAARRITVRAA
jgi:HSP20 family protein